MSIKYNLNLIYPRGVAVPSDQASHQQRRAVANQRRHETGEYK